jgi:hypothetical protein
VAQAREQCAKRLEAVGCDHCAKNIRAIGEQACPKKMTPWYSSKIKPVRAGVYEVYTPNALENKYAYFDNKGWRLCASYVWLAELEKKWPCANSSGMYLSRSMWRGFTEEQA